MWKIVYEKRVQKDLDNLKTVGLDQNARRLIEILKVNPYQLPYEKLIGGLSGFYSRRINLRHRLVYKVIKDEMTVVVISMWSHYA